MFSKSKKMIITIDGMMCEHCKRKVENALTSLNGVLKVKVDLKKRLAVVNVNDSVQADDIKNAIARLDYKVIDIKSR